jgi:hypothetical protein
MERSELYQDIAFILFLVPFIVPAVYSFYLWLGYGLSPFLPSEVYLQVTRDPYVFLVGIFSVIVGSVVEIISYKQEERNGGLGMLSSNLQKIGILSFLLSLLSSWYSNHFADLSGTFLDLLVGKYNIIFPFLLFLFSFLIILPFNMSWFRNRYFLSSLLLILVVPLMYLGRRNPILSFSISFVFLLAAVWIIGLKREVDKDRAKS